MSENVAPVSVSLPENSTARRGTKLEEKPAATRRALQDVSNNPHKEFQISSNYGKRSRSESLEVIDESVLEKRTRSSSLHSLSAMAETSPLLICSSSPVKSPSFVVRVALDPSVTPKPVYGQQDELEDDRDPQMCEEYAEDIYSFMYRTQECYMVNPSYIDRMPPGHRWAHNRSTLLNWLLTVHRKFRLVTETLYLAANIIDRYLSVELIELEQVQLLAASALFVSSKYEEVMTPAISNFAFVANAQVQDIRAMEQKVLIALQFELGYPCPLNFLRRISRADDYDMRTRTVAKFMLEMSIFEPRLMVFRPSDVAAAAMYVARLILGMGPWSDNFIYYSGGCTEDGLAPIVEIMTEYLQDACEKRDPEFVRQYMSKKVLRAALLATQWARGEPAFKDLTQSSRSVLTK